MIEIIANLSQGVYLAGESIEVAITFKNPSPPPDAKSQWNDQEEILAWASAQIHCQCWVNPSSVKGVDNITSTSTAEEQAVTNSKTSFAPCTLDDTAERTNTSGGNQGATAPARIVSSTKPTILFCALRLLPGESETYSYKETIPIEGPPSFRGYCVKYAYKLTIGTQRVNCPIKLLRIPFKVLVLQEYSDHSVFNENEDVTPANPFLSDEDKISPLNTAMQVLQIMTSQRYQKVYNVTNSKGHVVKFSIFKQAFKLGEDIIGSLTFLGSVVPCVQYAVTLQSVEDVTTDHKKGVNQKPNVTSYSKCYEMCLGYENTHFVLPVPLNVTPSFNTDLIRLKWRLHFEFVTSTKTLQELKMIPTVPPSKDSLNGAIWKAPANIPIETMIWDLPIKIYPNSPNYVSLGLQMETKFDMKISYSHQKS